ncbi:glycosyltransferase family 2 protein [Pseudalkalibacillus berkeleyi]|uniref:Glycosyltransferase family 2 protein n=1 Tax=Pseudalkalibacillus berkeleyi TaxID=1069813 RepID=A0ABS9GVR2_9BACL|nr:glycosyltransferase family 2 protein [Pseudalkalibacillus berkeleyi]MCF6136894.1 glycosyltransferase family 2 protein [Pseudalkalibacillus berkeleyi]
MKYEKEITVIIPTYNKYPQNLLTLYSLTHQTFDLTKVEVIMVDDGSTDETESITKLHNFPFEFNYMKCRTNIGRPAARNKGLKMAKGKVIIFLDAEILVRPDFLTIHHQYHAETTNLVVSGIMFLKRLYSVLFPDFSEEQLEECMRLMIRNRTLYKKLESFNTQPHILPLIEKSDIENDSFQKLSLPSKVEVFYKEIIVKNYGYGLSNYQIPWQLFGTGHVSVSKKALDEVGLFEVYPGYGWDDCEMGYRLYKNGATYLTDRRLISYHQEHPIAPTIKNESKQNYYLFQEKYKEVDQMIISLTFLPVPFNLHQTNQILVNYKRLCKEHPKSFPIMKKYFQSMLRKIGFLASKSMNITNLKPTPTNMTELHQLELEKERLKELNIYMTFLQCFKRLENL